jgi:hypothetical protein
MPTWINAIVGFLAIPLVTRMFPPEVLGKFICLIHMDTFFAVSRSPD